MLKSYENIKYLLPLFNMVGLPDENLKETWDTADINVKAKPNWAWFSVYQTLPHTELARYALEKNIWEKWMWRKQIRPFMKIV